MLSLIPAYKCTIWKYCLLGKVYTGRGSPGQPDDLAYKKETYKNKQTFFPHYPKRGFSEHIHEVKYS